LLTGLVFGIAPSLQASGSGIDESLREGRSAGGGPGRRKLRGLLIVSEVAASLVLLAGAGLMIRSFARLLSVEPGFDARGVLTMRVLPPETLYPGDDDVRRFYARVEDEVARLPGVAAVGLTRVLPLTGANNSSVIALDGQPYFDPDGSFVAANVR